MSLNLTDGKSTLVQVMAWCHQATSHYLSQCWPKFMLPCGVTRPWWVNSSSLRDAYVNLTIIGLDDGLLLIDTKPLSESIAIYCWLDPLQQVSVFFRNLYQNIKCFIQGNGFVNVFCKETAILFHPQCVNPVRPEESWILTTSSRSEGGCCIKKMKLKQMTISLIALGYWDIKSSLV